MIRSYGSIAAQYDQMHDRWLRYAGGEAQVALEACAVTRIAPGDRVLDAGCGTGALSRALSARLDGLSLKLLDACPEMLAQTEDVPGERIQGSLLDLPFAEASFDHAIAAWAIEVTGDATRAVAELMRVVRPGGHVMVAFCATEPTGRLAARVLRKTVEWRGTGAFLEAERIENTFRAHGAARVVRHRCNGPVAVIDAERAEALALAA